MTRRSASPAPKTPSPVRVVAKGAAHDDDNIDTATAAALLTYKDPTFLFAVSCLFSVLAVEGDEATMTLKVKKFDAAKAVSHLFDPAILMGIMVAVSALKFVFDKGIKKGAGNNKSRRMDFLRAGWFLWNAAFIHVTMDGLGSLGFLPMMRANYELLDARLKSEHENAKRAAQGLYTASGGEIALVDFIVKTELFVMSICCFGAFYGILTGAPFRDEFEIVASMMHLAGTLVWCVPEIMIGCINCVPIGKLGCIPGTSLYELFYFWFAFGINVVWIIVPLWCVVAAFERSVALKAAARTIMKNTTFSVKKE